MPTNKTSGKAVRAKPKETFLEKLLEHPDASDALQELEADGMSQDLTVAFLYVIAFCRNGNRGSTLRSELPHPEKLRATAARVQWLRDEIAAFNSNPFLDPQRSLSGALLEQYGSVFQWLPRVLGAYTAYLQVQASLMAEFGKTKPKTPKMLVIKMLERVKQVTGKEHYHTIARLLTAADAAYGREDEVEASALKMMLQRHRKSMLRPHPLAKALAKAYVHVPEKKGPFSGRLGN